MRFLVLVQPPSLPTQNKIPLTFSPFIHSYITCMPMTHRPMVIVTPPTFRLDLVSRLTFCISDLSKAYSSLRLQLNPSKTEFIWFGARCNLSKISPAHLSLSFDSSTVPCSTVVRDLGVLLDSETMKRHIIKVTSICYSSQKYTPNLQL